jgi:hypothetical protein
MAHRKRINIGFGGLFRLPRPEAARVDDINPIITVIDTEKEQINDVHTDIDAESGKLSNRNNRACHPDSIQLHNRAMTQPPVNDMQQLELPRDNRRHFRLSSDHSPTARSFSFTTATNTKETISENVLNLHVAESVLESHRVTSLASAMELWGAWNILRSRGRMSTRSSSMGAHLPSSLLSPVSGTDARSLADNFLLQLPIDHRSASSRSPISERSRASSIYDIDSIVQVANATERGGPQQDGVALKRNASIISNRNQINIFTLVDNCPICFKCEVRGEHASAKENVKENMAPWHKSRRILRIVLYHYFPLLYTWEIQGFIGKFLGIINFIPVFLLSLSTPVIALFDEEEMSLSEECVDLDPQQYSVNQTKSSSTADNIANIVCIVQDCEHSNSSSREQSPSRTSRTSRLTSKAPSRTGKPASTPSTPRHTSPIDATRYVARDSAACPFGVCEVITWNHLPINFLQILFAPLLISFGLKCKH